MAATETRVSDLDPVTTVTATHKLIVQTDTGTQLATVDAVNAPAYATLVAAFNAALAAFNAAVS